MRTRIIVASLVVASVTTVGVVAQQRTGAPPAPAPSQPSANALVSSTKFGYDGFKGYLTKAAEQMPEADYAFKPAGVAAEVRTFGQLIGHLADANFGLCAAATGSAPPATPKDVEKTMKTKADLQKALADAFAFCDRAWAGTTDANAATAAEMPFGLGRSTRLGILTFNSTHNGEHYGNIVTYMRAKGLVPPSSAPRGRGGF
jgi:uncharacterized damage-inducible protein DinB